MSNIRVDTFSPSGGGTAKSLRGIAAAWANLDGTGTIALRDSQNVSSVVDGGTGLYGFNFTAAFSAATYATVSGQNTAGTLSGSATASAKDVTTVNSAGASTDASLVEVGMDGDLA